MNKLFKIYWFVVLCGFIMFLLIVCNDDDNLENKFLEVNFDINVNVEIYVGGELGIIFNNFVFVYEDFIFVMENVGMIDKFKYGEYFFECFYM